MERYDGVTPVVGSLVTVYDAGTLDPATIYADDLSTPLGNPFTSDALTGAYTFWAALASYDIVIGTSGTPTPPPSLSDAAFGRIAVAGEDTVEAEIVHDAFALVAGPNVTITTDAAQKSITITAVSTALTPSATVAALDGTSNAGASDDYSRGDHRHSDANRPTDGEKAALAGTGTPGGSNDVTNDDSRLTNARSPTAHATSHSSGGSDPVSVVNLAGFPGGTTTFLAADGTFRTPAGSGGNVSAAGTLTSGQLVIGQGTQAVAVSNLTGDVTTAGGVATVIAANAVTNTQLRDSAALSVIGRSANSSGDPADIAGATAGQILQVLSGPTVGWSNLQMPKTVVKASDQSVTSSAAPVDDSELLFAVGANETWVVEMVLFVIGGTAGDIRVGLAAPASATGSMGTIGFNSGTATSVQIDVKRNDFTDTGVNGLGVAVDPGSMILLKARVVNSSTPGNVILRWAQLTSNGTATTVKAGSYLTAIRVA